MTTSLPLMSQVLHTPVHDDDSKDSTFPINALQHPPDPVGIDLRCGAAQCSAIALRLEPHPEVQLAAGRARGVDRGQVDAVLLEYMQQHA